MRTNLLRNPHNQLRRLNGPFLRALGWWLVGGAAGPAARREAGGQCRRWYRWETGELCGQHCGAAQTLPAAAAPVWTRARERLVLRGAATEQTPAPGSLQPTGDRLSLAKHARLLLASSLLTVIKCQRQRPPGPCRSLSPLGALTEPGAMSARPLPLGSSPCAHPLRSCPPRDTAPYKSLGN